MVGGNLQIGYAGTGIVNLSGSSVLHAGVLSFGAAGGNGVVNMEGNSRFLVNTDVTGSDFIGSGLILAINAGAGKSIQEVYVPANNWTEYTVIPEPATLGMVALLGGGLLWIRKWFAI